MAAAGTGAVRPADSATAAVQGFMQAVADSNLDPMAALWGTAKGPAAGPTSRQTTSGGSRSCRPTSAHDDSRIASDVPDGIGTRHAVQVQLRRQACTWTVPFGVIQLSDGSWIVNQVDLTAAGNPARPCDPVRCGHVDRPLVAGNLPPSRLLSYSVSSSRMPAVAFGCTKAIRRPPAPVRGTSSTSR